MALDSDDWMVLGLMAGALVLLVQSSRAQAAAAAGGVDLSFPPAAPSVEGDLSSIVPMSVSPAGVQAIKAREGFTATPIADGAREEIGYGHDIQPGEQFSSITEGQGTVLLVNDLADVAGVINDSVSVPLTQNQFDALASLVYNIGATAFRRSTLLNILNAGNYAGAAAQFARWNQSGGQINSGLIARRRGEAAQFTS